MSTSESDDFESADEELTSNQTHQAPTEQGTPRPKRYTSIGSDSDDDVDFIPVQYQKPIRSSGKKTKNSSQRKRHSTDKVNDKSDKIQMETNSSTDKNDLQSAKNNEQDDCNSNIKASKESKLETSAATENTGNGVKPKNVSKRERPQRERKPKETQSFGAKKLGAVKIDKLPDVETTTPDQVKENSVSEGKSPPLIQECWEEINEKNLEEELNKASQQQNQLQEKNVSEDDLIDAENMPEELMSNLKFKDIFKPDGWEGIGDDVDLPDDLSDDKYQPVLNKLASSVMTKQDSTNGGWSGWGSWGMSSLLNTASVGVSTLTSHVSQGLSLLEETIGVPNPGDLAKAESPLEEEKKIETPLEEKSKVESPIVEQPKAESPLEEQPKSIDKESEDDKDNQSESQSQYLSSGFGFGNFMSSMSSFSKLVESTSSKVISGGLDTLEVIGKKTMEVLQEGDPGLKKKRAFFMNEVDKPILSHILREAKDKADLEEKSLEEKQLARKVHFESLFDDYQGLVHLEALEMLSKQCNMKIQQQLVNLVDDDLTSMQETLDEVKELCDLGEDDEEEEEEEGQTEKDLKQKLEEACKDLGVSTTYDKLVDVWNNINSQFSSTESKDISHREIFQTAISALAQFTAYSVERFHKTAELLLIKQRRSTVNEADSLVQLTKTLSSQIGIVANLYCNQLNAMKNEDDKSEITTSTTTICLEATNASSYVQEAFRLLIPILQVGAI